MTGIADVPDDAHSAIQDLAEKDPTENYQDEFESLLELLGEIIKDSETRRIELNAEMPGVNAMYVTPEGASDPTEEDGDLWFEYED